ncbi:MAG: hypothetical protein KKA67_09535 [Spirochaetes bacterium]|nr:hypothetical protein [Spirochaetota bacterium]MBU1081451.1 hypothetical protein [Spirochaetota bacterium]
MRIRLGAVVAAAALLSSCASLGDPFMLAFDVDAKYQSEAICAAGIDQYRERLVARGEVSASAEVQRYFEAALRYDPMNAEATRYLALVEDYRASRFSASMKQAEALLKKESRNPNDEYAMLVSVRRALDIYPGDDSAIQLLNSTKDARKAYVKARLAEAEAIKGAIDPEAKDSAKERAYIAAFTIVTRVNDVEPRDVEGARAYRELKTEIAAIVKRRLDGVGALSSSAKFDEAKTVVSLVRELDSKIGRAFEPDIQKAEYGLYLAWAKYHESRKEWAKADSRVKAALAIQKGSEAAALQKRVAAAADAEERGASFDAGLKNLDRYIAKEDYLRAQRLLSSLSRTAADSAQRRALEQRRKAMLDAIGSLYEAGVKAYRAERFKDAAAAFEVVAAIDPSYQDVADYLEKARAKQKLLDQY